MAIDRVVIQRGAIGRNTEVLLGLGVVGVHVHLGEVGDSLLVGFLLDLVLICILWHLGLNGF